MISAKIEMRQQARLHGVRDVEVRIWAGSFFVAFVLKYILL